MAVTPHAAADHGALQHVDRGKQRCGAMADVAVGLVLGVTLRDGSARAGALQGMDLALLILSLSKDRRARARRRGAADREDLKAVA